MKKINLIKNLVQLESYSSKSLGLDFYEEKFIWNVFLRYKYFSPPVKITASETLRLTNCVSHKGNKLPYFLLLISKFYGDSFLLEKFESQEIFTNFKNYQINFILSILYNHLLSSRPFNNELLRELYKPIILFQDKPSIPQLLLIFLDSDTKLKNLNLNQDVDYLFFLGGIYSSHLNWLSNFELGGGKLDSNLLEFLNVIVYSIKIDSYNYHITNSMLGFYFYHNDVLPLSLNIDNEKLIDIYNWNLDKFGNLYKLKHRGKIPFLNYKQSFRSNRGINFERPPESIKNSFVRKNVIKHAANTGANGINIIGYPNSLNGIGEDSRVFASILSKASINFNIFDIYDNFPISAKQVEFKIKSGKYKKFKRFDLDIAFLDPFSLYKYYSVLKINNLNLPKKIISVCPWEMEKWDKKLSFIFDQVDYFFAATNFIFNSFAEIFKKDRIFLAPPAVHIDENFIDSFNVESIDEPFVFISISDGASSFLRKNPEGAVLAFIKAFPKTQKDVRLIVKVMNTDYSSDFLNRLKSIIKYDNRITLLNESMTKASLFKLIKSAHCFVSLHRSEGFGRNIAESMLLNRPVIVSNYSGNVDFCNAGNSFLVDGAIKPAGNNYAFSEGLNWFEPNIDEAVEKFRSVYFDRRNASNIASKGRDFVNLNYSLEEAMMRYKKLLKNLNY